MIKQKKVIFLIVSLLVFLIPNISESKSSTREAHSLYNEAISAYRRRHFNLAKQTLYELIEKYPDDRITSIARSNLATMLKDLKEYDKAIELYKEIIEKSDEKTEKEGAKLQLVGVLYSIHRYREGIELLNKWIKEKEKDIDEEKTNFKKENLINDLVNLNLELVKFYMQTGSKDEAWLLLEKFMVRKKEGDQKAFDALLDMAIRSGEVDKLINTINQSYYLEEKVRFSYLADCYLALGRKDKAIESLKSINGYDEKADILKKLIDMQISANLLDDAIFNLEKVVRNSPDWQNYRKLGHCYFLKGNKEKAVEVWRTPLTKRRYGRTQEQYMNITAVFIEHQLLEQALEAFDEARNDVGDNSIFAEEKAAVLEALGREKEAMEEYLNVLSRGEYKSEIFDKLYNAKIEDFSLEDRLNSLNNGYYNQAINQALIELYFRKTRLEDIDKLANLINSDDAIFYDDLFFNKLKQEALLVPEDFHFILMKKMMEKRKNSILELKLASLILNMPEYSEKWKKEAYKYAKNTAISDLIIDSDLKYELFLQLSDYAFKYMKSVKDANSYLDLLLAQKVIAPSKEQIIRANLKKAMINTYMSNFTDSEKILSETGSILDKSNREGGLTILEREEFIMQKKVEEARLKAHKGEYQEALNLLKDIIENHKEGDWVNDGLEIALEIVRYSVGDFSALEHRLKSERFIACGQNSEAIKEIDLALKAVPASSTALIADLEADKIMLTSDDSDFNELSNKIKLFMAKYPDNLKNADIGDFKIKLMQRLNKSKDEIDEEMRTYIINFPSDLRSEKYKKSLENGVKK